MNSLEKSYPSSYPRDVLEYIQTMAFKKGNVRIMGSMALRSQMYGADYDCYQVIESSEASDTRALKLYAKEFQHIIKNIKNMSNCFITDIKAGSVEEWRILPENAKIQNGKIVNIDIDECKKKIKQLQKDKILSKEQAHEYMESLTYMTTPEDFVILKKEIRPNIIRWNSIEVAKGYKILKDGRKFTLEEAFSSPVITKVDIIGWIQGNRFSEFSMIYKFMNKGAALNLHSEDVEQALKESFIYYRHENKWFKVAKRMFSYARFHDDERTLRELTPLLNSDLGRLYVIMSDIDTIAMLLEGGHDVTKSKIVFELDQLRARFSTIYTVPNFLKVEPYIVKILQDSISQSDETIIGNAKLIQDLKDMANVISIIVNNDAEIELIRLGYLPLDAKYSL